MKTRAAVALEKGKPLTVTDVELDGPKASEVLVEVKPRAFVTPTSSRCPGRIRRAYSRPS
jgi:Zn-dependent alcohol dehydrogenase